MSGNNLWFNMVAGAVLATGLGIMGLRTVGDMVFANNQEAIGYPVAVAEVAAAGAAVAAGPELMPDWGTVLADPVQLASLVAKGDEAHRVCASCHAVESGGANKVGPLLYGVFNRTAGTHAGFAYSDAMKAYGKAWDYDGLYNFLKAPKAYIEGTSMSYAGMPKQADRVALVAYLRSLSPSPAAIPAPDPARDPAKVAAAVPVAGAAPAAAGAAPPAEGGTVTNAVSPEGTAAAPAETTIAPAPMAPSAPAAVAPVVTPAAPK